MTSLTAAFESALWRTFALALGTGLFAWLLDRIFGGPK